MGRPAGRKTAPAKKTAADDKKYLCPYCLKSKKETEFYTSSDPLVLTGKTIMCKECARKIALNWDERTQQFGTCTKASVQEALIRLDKPFLNRIWDSSYLEWADDKTKNKEQQSGMHILKILVWFNIVVCVGKIVTFLMFMWKRQNKLQK